MQRYEAPPQTPGGRLAEKGEEGVADSAHRACFTLYYKVHYSESDIGRFDAGVLNERARLMNATVPLTAVAATCVLLAAAVGLRAHPQDDDPADDQPSATARPAAIVPVGLLYGRVTTADGDVYEGRLRFGGDEEALWSNHFNGRKRQNPWADYASGEQVPRERLSWEIFGVQIDLTARPQLDRPFMARFGDITRIEARGRDLRVTMKSGTVHHLDRYAADDYADGVRVWDDRLGIVDLGERRIRSIEFLPAPQGPGSAAEFGDLGPAEEAGPLPAEGPPVPIRYEDDSLLIIEMMEREGVVSQADRVGRRSLERLPRAVGQAVFLHHGPADRLQGGDREGNPREAQGPRLYLVTARPPSGAGCSTDDVIHRHL